MTPPLADAHALVREVFRECLAPPPRVTPGAELQHLVGEVFMLREQLRLLADAVDALRREVRRNG